MKYQVELRRSYVVCDYVNVEAESEEDAYDVANKKFAELVRPLPPQFYGEVAEFCETDAIVLQEVK